MQRIKKHTLSDDEAAIWHLGQAGYVIRSCGITVVIDPYLTDSAAASAPEFSRLFPPPIEPEDLEADFYLITHDHLDHLDPETISRYPHKEETCFVGPRLVCKHLLELGIPSEKIHRIDSGESRNLDGLEILGVFTIPTGADVIDTTGYHITFPNGRNVYHTSDTIHHPVVLAAAPVSPELMLVPINGKWGNPSPEQASEFTRHVNPGFVFPNHYDLMALNSENPETFKWHCRQAGITDRCVIPARMEAFVWKEESK